VIPVWFKTLIRLLEGVMNAINRKSKKDAADDPADTIANGGRVRESEQSFSDMASKSGSDKTE